ncbi:MAG: hypothetical protein ACYDH9_19800 [Limisphaerales bacterium]
MWNYYLPEFAKTFLKLADNSLTRCPRTGSRFMTTRGIVMKQRFFLFRRAGVFYCEDTTTRKQISLRTKDEAEALTLLHAKNESYRQPVLNRQIARTYLAATDPEAATRTWQMPMDEMTKTKTGSTRVPHERAIMDKAFNLIRNLPILETQSAHFLKVFEAGSIVSGKRGALYSTQLGGDKLSG